MSLMSRSSILGALLMLVVTSGCSGISVNTDYDRAVDFSRLKSYAWREPAASATAGGGAVSELTHRRIRDAVDATLVARGFVLAAPPASADFQVSYRAAVTREIEATPSYSAVGYGGWRGGAGGVEYVRTGTDVRTFNRGTLVIDLIDPRASALVWCGTATATVHEDRTPEEREARIREAVSKILERFPPTK